MSEAGARLPLEQLGLAPRAAAGDAGNLEAECARVVVARRRRQQHGRVGPWRDPANPGRRGAQDQAADTLRHVARELLREAAAEGVAEHVDGSEPEVVEQRRDDPGQAAHAQRARWALRAAGSRRIEGDDLAVAGYVQERLPHVEVGADTGHEDQRGTGAGAARDAQLETVRACEERRPAHANAPMPVMSRPDDQRLHGLGALVGVDDLDVAHVADDVVLQQDAVAAEQVARLGDHPARPCACC